MSLNGSEVSKYENTDAKKDTLLLLLVNQFTYLIPSETVVYMKTSIPKIGECYLFLVVCSGNVQGRIFLTVVLKHNYGNLPYIGKTSNYWTNFYGNVL